MAVIRSLSSDVRPDLTRELAICDLAAVLFSSTLQESDHPSPEQVRTAVLETLQTCGGDCGPCVACVAEEAGDHPESYARRMRWSLQTVKAAYAPADLIAA
jgi:hypothetical protein